MELQLCARCKKNPAVVFITRLENNKTVNEGICLKCAKELGIKPIDDMIKKMGLTDEDIENMNAGLEGFMSENLPDVNDGDDKMEDGGAPAIDLPKLFRNFGFAAPSGETSSRAGAKNDGDKKPRKDDGRKYLSMYCQNLTEKAALGQIDDVIGREREIDRVVQILCRRQKNNPCLIGEPGVGKTAIAEALALRIARGQVPGRLADCEIHLLDLTALVAGTQFRGQFESRILGLINEVKKAGNIILMIDEVHNIVGAGDSEGSMSAANILKPALSRGEIQVIGATTLKEYRKYIEKDSALERRFQPVTVNEPSVEDTVNILKGIRKYYENFHSVKIPEDIIRSAVSLSERYITDRFLPDKAIDLLDEAASKVSLSSKELNEYRSNEKELGEIAEHKKSIENEITAENDEEKSEEKYKLLADLRVREMQLTSRQEELSKICSNICVTQDDLAKVVEIWTGIPASEISAGDFKTLSGLYDRISEEIVGQDEAVSAVVRAIKRKRAGISYRRNPVSMIFAGPTGVGKTELVKVLARQLFKQPESLIRLDMSEFMEKHSVSRIIGAPPGYVGYDEAGQLTEKIRRRPYAVILFDEIEKAHPDVLNILLQILDDGMITDASGRQVNFENTIIIMTTNAGSVNSLNISGFGGKGEDAARSKTEKALSEFLRPEFINRIDEIITFRSLTPEDFEKIAGIMLKKLVNAMEERGIRVTYDPELLKFIAKKSYSEKYGARNMRRFIETHVEDRLAEVIIDRYEDRLTGAHLSLDGEEIKVSCI